MRILITNDDGYKAKGIKELVDILRPYGDLTVVAPKHVQSATSMAVTMGLRPIAVKTLSESASEKWMYVDASPASCVKFGISIEMEDKLPDIVVSGINHGGNYATAALYSGTLGAAQEAALAGFPSIGVSLDSLAEDADFSVVARYFPAIFEALTANPAERFGIYYNVNFPAVKPEKVKGIRIAGQGVIRWVKEFTPFDYSIFEKKGITPKDMGMPALPEIEPGEEVYVMGGEVVRDPANGPYSDVNLIKDGYITITAHSILTADSEEAARLKSAGIESLVK